MVARPRYSADVRRSVYLEIVRLFAGARRERLTHAQLLDGRTRIQAGPSWSRGTREMVAYWNGSFDALMDEVWTRVVFCYVTDRGPTVIRPDAPRAPGMPILTDEECRIAETMPRGYAYPPTDLLPLVWFTGPFDPVVCP